MLLMRRYLICVFVVDEFCSCCSVDDGHLFSLLVVSEGRPVPVEFILLIVD